ncbi:protein of unknown function [Burkholderia multivorans]
MGGGVRPTSHARPFTPASSRLALHTRLVHACPRTSGRTAVRRRRYRARTPPYRCGRSAHHAYIVASTAPIPRPRPIHWRDSRNSDGHSRRAASSGANGFRRARVSSLPGDRVRVKYRAFGARRPGVAADKPPNDEFWLSRIRRGARPYRPRAPPREVTKGWK